MTETDEMYRMQPDPDRVSRLARTAVDSFEPTIGMLAEGAARIPVVEIGWFGRVWRLGSKLDPGLHEAFQEAVRDMVSSVAEVAYRKGFNDRGNLISKGAEDGDS